MQMFVEKNENLSKARENNIKRYTSPLASFNKYKNMNIFVVSKLTAKFYMKSYVFSICTQFLQCVPSKLMEI